MPRSLPFLSSRSFWGTFLVVFVACAAVIWWETFHLIRPPVTQWEMLFIVLLLILLPLDAGLYAWKRTHGACPAGARNATGIAGGIGVVALLCPSCTIIPLTLLGTTLTLGFLLPFLPLLRLIAVVLAVSSLLILWPSGRNLRR